MGKRGAMIVALLLALTLAVAAWAGGSAVRDVTVGEARTLMQERAGKADFIILDVRTPAEFTEGRLSGAMKGDVGAETTWQLGVRRGFEGPPEKRTWVKGDARGGAPKWIFSKYIPLENLHPSGMTIRLDGIVEA